MMVSRLGSEDLDQAMRLVIQYLATSAITTGVKGGRSEREDGTARSDSQEDVALSCL